MNTEQQAAAKGLYFQTSLSVTQIGEVLQIPRRTLHYWIRTQNWDRIKQSSAIMPTLVAENCTLMIARLSENILSEDRMMKPCTHIEASTMYKLALTAGKMKTRATLSENLEMIGFFMDHVNKQSPEMATAVLPFVESYISARAAININQLTPEHFNELGFIPKTEKDNTETKLDMQDIMEWSLKDKPAVDIEQFRSMKDPIPTNPPADYFDPPKYAPSTAAEPLPSTPINFSTSVENAPADVVTSIASTPENNTQNVTDIDIQKYLADFYAQHPAPEKPDLSTLEGFLKYQENLINPQNGQTNKAA